MLPRLRAVFMAQTPKKPRRRPEDAPERTDHEVIEMLFGREAAEELERMDGVNVSMKGS